MGNSTKNDISDRFPIDQQATSIMKMIFAELFSALKIGLHFRKAATKNKKNEIHFR